MFVPVLYGLQYAKGQEIFDQPAGVGRRSEQAQKLVRDRFTWDKTIGPLDEFIRAPAFNRPRRTQISIRIGQPSAARLASQLGRVLLSQGSAGLWREVRRRLKRPAS